MSKIPQDLRYSKEHEYVKPLDQGLIQVGITDYAQDQLGDVVYVDLPKVGASFDAMQVFGTIEAVKAVSELFCPIAGEVTEVNGAIENDPAVVNRDPYGAGWMIKLRPKNTADANALLSAGQYQQHIGE
jgi:glycine cleavage system H protein